MISHDDIARAAAVLRAGGLVAFPTETVYGLGADARNPDAIRRLFAAKGRPVDHPVIVHLARVEQIGEWAARVPPVAQQLAAAFWPGPLTLILPRAPHVLDLVTGGQDSVGIRVPSHPVARELLAAFGDGIVAPSANRFGRLSPTTAAHVRAELGDAVACILDGGPTTVGVESTIVDCTGKRPVLLRPGKITPAQLAAVIGAPPAAPTAAAPRASGTLPRHYAPQTPLEIVPPDDLAERAARLHDTGTRAAVLSRRTAPEWLPDPSAWYVMPRDAAPYARTLYATLHDLDARGYQRILVEAAPDGDGWLAVRDRLRRAAAPREEPTPPAPSTDREGNGEGDASSDARHSPAGDAASVSPLASRYTAGGFGDPLVSVVMGSTSDWETMRHADDILTQFGVPHECRVVSAHRTPDLMAAFAAGAERRGIAVIIAGAGGAAHLPGMIAAHTLVPVLGVPVESHALKGMDSLLSIVQMPGGVPVGTLAIGRAGATNAALLAVAILATTRPDLRERLREYRAAQAARVQEATLP